MLGTDEWDRIPKPSFMQLNEAMAVLVFLSCHPVKHFG